MTKPILTYEELLEEKARLKSLLSAQKDLVRQDINMIKVELVPVRKALSIVGKFATKDNRYGMLSMAADAIIDMFVKRVVLSKAGFITKMAVPFLMKNFSSHVIADNKDKIINALASFFGKKQENGMHENGAMASEAPNEGATTEEEEED